MRGLSRRIGLCALLCVAALTVHARVFQRWGTAARSDRALGSQGGTVVYTAPILINGAEAELSLFSFRDSIGTVISRLRSTFKLAEDVFKNGTLGFAAVHTEGHVLRLIVFRLTGEDQTLVFKIEQTEEQFAASRQAPDTATVAGLPPFPSAQPIFTASDTAADMSVAVAGSSADASTIHAFYAAALAARTWRPALPAALSARDPAMLVYLKPDQVCCVLVDAEPNSTVNRITLLHKRLRSE